MTGPDLNRHDPLTAEERELAKLLGGRLDKAPPPAVDAAVLAAARAAVLDERGGYDAAPSAAPDVHTSRLQHRRPRWPAVFGVAASVVFAVGLAWQLRPEPPQAPARVEAAPAPAPAAADSSAPAARPAQADEAAAMQADERPATESAAPAEAPRQARRAPEPALAPEPAPAPPPVVAKPAPRERAVPPGAPLPAPSAAPAAAPARAPAPARADAYAAAPAAAMEADAAEPRAADAESSPSRTARSLRAAPANTQANNPQAFSQRKQAASLSAEAVQDAVLADAQLTRRQWLQKIRHRRDAGDVDVARASLERYLFQYPETRLPRDLQPLLAD